jgi:DNA repair protein RadC
VICVQEYEHIVVLYLDTRNRVTSCEILYKGSLNTSWVRIAEVFRGAVRRNCAALIVAHNPAPEDVALTRCLVDAGKLLEVDVLDHVLLPQ